MSQPPCGQNYSAQPHYPPYAGHPQYGYPPQGGHPGYPPQGQQPQLKAETVGSAELMVEVQWIPPTLDAPQVDKWFSDLDKEGRGIVGGLEIAKFLRRSNLPKETLRTIWALIDNKNLGYVSKSQFNNIIRLVSVCCSPIYMGSPPSMERLQKTLYDKIPLPAALYVPGPGETAEAPPALTAMPSTAVLTTPAMTMGVPGMHTTPLPSSHAPSAGLVQDEDDEFSDFASASSHVSSANASTSTAAMSMAGGAGMNRIDAAMDEATAPVGPQWVPAAKEQEMLDKWFLELDADGKGRVGGMAIAMFLKRSNLSKDTLRTIWSLVDSKNAGHVSKQQFANIIRLLSISCSPIYMGAAPSLERLEKTLTATIPLPAALTEGTSTSATPDASAAVQYSSVSMQRTPSGISATSAPPPVPAPTLPPTVNPPQPWVPNAIDATYIEKWFAELDPERKGVVGGMAVVMFLKKSQLPKETLRTIWSMADSAHAGHISKEQFATMMRLVAIQCHPAYAALPPSLERLAQTNAEFIPLPLSLVHGEAPGPNSVAPAAPVPAVVPTTPEDVVSTTDTSPQPAIVMPSAGASTADGPSAVLPPAGEVQWLPPPVERDIIDRWFAELDPENTGKVGGLAIAMFLKRSNLSKDTLRTIWSLVDSKNAGHVSKQQFANIIRLVSLQCTPPYGSYPPSMEGLAHTLHEHILLPLSLFAQAPVPVPTTEPMPVQSVEAPVQVAAEEATSVKEGGSADPSTVPAGTEVPAVYWVPPSADAEVVDRWFAELDPESTGKVGGLAIAMFLKRSNLSKDTLRTIWSLVDSKNAGHVSKQQFANIIRLVSISCSPIYMGAAPSLERLEKTLAADIPLPYALTSTESTSVTSTPAAASVGVVRVESVDEDEDAMGDFASAGESSTGAGSSAAPVAPVPAAEASAPTSAKHRLSVFDDLVENDLKGLDEEWDDFAEGQHQGSPAPVAVQEEPADKVAEVPDDVFEDIPPAQPASDFLDLVEADLSMPLPAPTETMQVSQSQGAVFEDPFGSLDAGDLVQPILPAAPTIVLDELEEQVATGAPLSVTVQPSAEAFDADFGDDDFGGDDFGDFETHSPMPERDAPQELPELSLFGDLTPPPISTSISEVTLFDAPSEHSDPFSAFNAPGPVPPAEVDLLDFLSDPTPAPSSTSMKGGITQPFAPSFGAFDNNTPLGHSPVPPVGPSAFPSINSSALLTDFFGSAPDSTVPTATKAQAGLASAESLAGRKPLTGKVLDSYTATLMKKYRFEHAYNCNEQAKVVRSIQDLNLRKMEAVESDDLETAVMLKKDIAMQQQKLQAIDQEALWEEAVQSNRPGESLEETADLLSAVDEVMGAKFKRRFLSAVPPASASLDAQLVFQVTARRYARMILAVCSTHQEYPRQWLLVLQIVVAKVKEGNEIVSNFKRMSATDRTALISHLKVSEYALGLVAISEIGLWVSASCMEAMVHEKIATEVFTVCQDLLGEVDTLWGMGSRFKTTTLDAFTLEAARLAECQRVQYCSFTLRPLSCEVFKQDAGKIKADKIKLYDNPVAIENAHYMEPVVKLWLHDISKSMPNCAAEAF